MLIRERTLMCEVFVICADIIEANGHVTVSDVHKEMGVCKWGYTTIKTVIDRLVDLKHLAVYPKEHRSSKIKYYLVTPKQSVLNKDLSLFCSKWLNGDWDKLSELVQTLKTQGAEATNPTLLKEETAAFKRRKEKSNYVRRRVKPFYNKITRQYVYGATLQEFEDYLRLSHRLRLQELSVQQSIKEELDKSGYNLVADNYTLIQPA